VGGAELLVDTISSTQASMGHDVGVAALSRSQQPAEKRNGVTVFRLGHSTPFFILDWPNQPGWKRQYYKLAVQFDFGFVKRLERVIDDFRPDIVNTHSLSELPPFIWRMLHRRKIPVVHTLHDFTSMCTNGSLFHDGHICTGKSMKCRLFSAIHRRCQCGVNAIAGVGTDIVARHVASGFFSKVPDNLRRVIWNPIEPPAKASNRRQRDDKITRFGYLGRIEASKGIDVLLDACRKLPPNGWELVVAGQAIEGLDSYRTATSHLPVKFIGYTDTDTFFETIDCLIVPPLWPEAFGRTVSESYLRGVPVLGSKLAGVAEQIGEDQAEWLFETGNVEELAEKMMRIIHLPEMLKRPIAHRESIMASTVPTAVSEQYISLYQSVLGSF
jgi:glycosyltransferase involved in cell wall biosynthesis